MDKKIWVNEKQRDSIKEKMQQVTILTYRLYLEQC